MAISRARLNDYVAALQEVVRRAQLDVRATFELYEIDGFEAALREVLAAARLATEVYGDISATLAAELYEEIALEEAQLILDATLADPYSYTDLEKEINYAAHNHLFDGSADTDGFKDFVDGVIDKVVKQPARNTIVNNSARDERRGVRYARIPMGANPCAFCRMLASQGFHYYSEESALFRKSDGGQYHDWCSCEPVPSWEESPRVEGYDPDAYLDEYFDARADAGGDTKAILAEMRKQCGCS